MKEKVRETLEFAAKNRISVIPLKHRDKRPLVEWKEYQKRMPTSEEIDNWFKRTDEINIGYVCGEVSEYLIVIDFDNKELYNLFENRLPITAIVMTARGYHVYFRVRTKVAKARFEVWKDGAKIGGIDVQGEGSYAVAPGSVHPSGEEYRFIRKVTPYLFEGDLVQWIQDTLLKYTKGKGFEIRGVKNDPIDIPMILKGVDEGARNDSCIRLATWYRKCGKEKQEALRLCTDWNMRNSPPLSDTELSRIVDSAYKIQEPYNYEFTSEKRKEFAYPTRHLPYFNEFRDLLGLKGHKYRVIEKALYYSVVGALLCRNISFGNIKMDTRVSVAIALPSGKGKKNIKNLFEAFSNELGLAFSNPTSLHPEQLVGKTVFRKKGKEEIPIQIKGHLADDIVLFEEGLELIRAKDDKYSESRNYMSIALDPIGQNEIVKRMVDFQREDSLRYSPKCTVVLLFQPYTLNEEVALQGLLRRFLFPFVDLFGYDFTKEYGERLRKRAENRDFLGFMKWIKDVQEEITMSEDITDKLAELHLKLLDGLRSRSEKSSNFINITDFTLQDILLKFAVILAAMREKWKVDTECLEFAFVDLFEIYSHCMEFIEKKIRGNLDYGHSWGGANNQERVCLEWLAEKGAISYESSNVSIKDYEEAIADICNLRPEGARRRYYAHKRASWIKSWKGKHDSKVWLAIEPPEHGKRGKSGNVYDKYWEIVEKIKVCPSRNEDIDSG